MKCYVTLKMPHFVSISTDKSSNRETNKNEYTLKLFIIFKKSHFM